MALHLNVDGQFLTAFIYVDEKLGRSNTKSLTINDTTVNVSAVYIGCGIARNGTIKIVR
jgi:hypothetical protein